MTGSEKGIGRMVKDSTSMSVFDGHVNVNLYKEGI